MPDYTNPTTGLFSGLAQGFFDSRRRQEDEARTQEDNSRNESLKVLTGLLDNATPETQPVLLRQIGDLMGVKGKERSIWDRLTGQGLMNRQDALQQKFRGILSNVVSEDDYSRMSKMLVPGTERVEQGSGGLGISGFGGFPGFPSIQGDTVNRAEGKVALRNPQKESLEKLRAQYELKSAADQEKFRINEEARQQNRLELETERQKNRLAAQENEAMQRAKQKVYERASQLTGGIEGAGNLEQAITEIADLNGLDRDKVRKQIDLLDATILKFRGQARQANATADAMAGSGIPGAKPLEVMKLNEGQRGRAEPIFGKYSAARNKAEALQKQISAAEAKINQVMGAAQGYKFDPTTSQLIDLKTGQPNALKTMMTAGMGGIDEDMKKISGLRQQLETLRGEEKSLGSQLRPYNEFYQERNGVFEPVAPLKMGTPRTQGGAPRATPPTPASRPTSGLRPVPPGASQAPSPIQPLGQTEFNPGGYTGAPGQTLPLVQGATAAEAGAAGRGRRSPTGGSSVPDIGKKFFFRDRNLHKPGEIVDMGGMQFRIEAIAPPKSGEVDREDKKYQAVRVR